MRIRPAAGSDAADLSELVVQLGYSGSAQDVLRRLTALGDGAVFVAVDEERAVGFIHVGIVRTLENDPYGEIFGLVVRDSHRGRGAGKLLLDAAEQWARGRALQRMRVRSNVTRDRAKQFYEREGYEVKKVSNVFDKSL